MTSQEAEIRARDEGAEGFEQWYIQKGILFDWVDKKTIMDALNVQSEDIVLDAGCGTGRLAREIAKRCRKVYAIDFSAKSIDILNRKLREEGIQNVETAVGDITKALPIQDQIDKVVSVQVVQKIPTEVQRYKALQNLSDHLKPGGLCVISVYNYGSLATRGLSKDGLPSSGVYRFRSTSREAEELFTKCGFKDISVTGCVNFKWYWHTLFNHRSLYRLFYPVAILDITLSRFKLSRSLGAFLLCKGFK